MGRPKKYPRELIARGLRRALKSERPIAHIAGPGDASGDAAKARPAGGGGSGLAAGPADVVPVPDPRTEVSARPRTLKLASYRGQA
jgi:hypothetical protein